MAHCEDYPCCGHELGCCPDFDPETGRQLNMKCVCGASVPLTSHTSLCAGCLADPDDPFGREEEECFECERYLSDCECEDEEAA